MRRQAILGSLGWLLLTGTCASLPALADSCQPYWTAEYKCMQGCGSCGGNPGGESYSGPSRRDIENAERAERNRQVDAINQQAVEAWQRRDYREALRFYEQQQMVRDGPNVRAAIAQVKALIAWHEATTAAEYRRAMVMQPGIFTQENVRYVEELEAKEKYERERLEREAEDIKVAGKIRAQISKFASSLDTAPPKAGLIVTQGGTLGDAMGTHKAAATLEFGDPNVLEARGEQARQGFDKAGSLAGSKPVRRDDSDTAGKPVLSSALAAQVPDKAKNDPLVKKSLDWYQHLDGLKLEAVQKIATVKAQQKNGSGDAAVLAAQLGALTNQVKQLDNDQAKAAEVVKKQVKNLGFTWIESAAPTTKEAKRK